MNIDISSKPSGERKGSLLIEETLLMDIVKCAYRIRGGGG